MNIDQKNLKNSELELTISLDQNELDSYVKKSVSAFKKSFKTDGYREGKVPEEIVKKEVGEKAIKEEALNMAVQESLAKAIEDNHFELIDYSDLKIKENTPEKLVFEVKLLLFPEVKLGDYQSVKVESKAIEVADSEIDDTIRQLKDMRTSFAPKDGVVAEGDRAEVDFEVKDKGQIIEGGKSDNHPVVVGKGGFVPGFEKQLIGMKVGEEKNFALEMPKDYFQKDVAGKMLDFHVKVNKIESPVTVQVNDEFARTLGSFGGLNDLKESIRAGLSQEKQAKEAERLRLAILDEILKDTTLEVPEKLINKQLDTIMVNFDQDLHNQGMEMGLYLAHIKKTQDELRASFKPQAEKQVKTTLIIREIGKKEAIIVTDEEIQNRIDELAATVNVDEELMKRQLSLEELKHRIRQTMFEEKVLTFLVSHAMIG